MQPISYQVPPDGSAPQGQQNPQPAVAVVSDQPTVVPVQPTVVPVQPIQSVQPPMVPQPVVDQSGQMYPQNVAVPQPAVAVPQPAVAVPQPAVAVPQAVAPVLPQFTPNQPVASNFAVHLDVLNNFGGLFIKQRMEVLEMITGFETENQYDVFLTGPDCQRGFNQQPYFYAQEHSDTCSRLCCGNMRAFNMTIVSPDGQVVMNLERPFKCSMGCCFLPELHISDGAGNKIGTVKNMFACCDHRFVIYDHEDMPVLSIYGSCCQCGMFCTCPCGPCSEIIFDIQNTETGSTGSIKKIWSGLGHEALTDADSFTLQYPPDATVYHKMLLLGAVFLIDFMYFEENQNDNNSYSVC